MGGSPRREVSCRWGLIQPVSIRFRGSVPPFPPSNRSRDYSEALVTPDHVRFWSLVLGGMYAVVAVAQPVLQVSADSGWVFIACVVASVTFLVAWAAQPLYPTDEAGLERQLGFMFTIAAMIAALDTALGLSALEVVHPVLVMTLTGAVVYRSDTVAVVILTAVLGLAGGALRQPEDPLWPGAAAFLFGAVGVTLALHFDRLQSGRRMREAWSRLRDQAVLDPLTGLANRRGFMMLGEQLLSRSRRDGSPLALVFIDIDKLKHINDHYGHAMGDQVIKAAGQEIRRCCRDGDVVARLGGDEFAVLAHNISPANLPKMVDRMRRQVTGLIAHKRGDLQWTASVGVVPVTRTDPGTLELAVASADRKMYADKRARRGEPIADSEPSSPRARPIPPSPDR